MYVRLHMSSPAVTIDQDRSLAEARDILRERRFRHLPVVDSRGLLAGMVTDRDIRSSLPSRLSQGERPNPLTSHLEQTPLREIMSVDPLFLGLGDTLDDALRILEKEKIGALPVVDGGGKVAGILSVQDLLKAYRELFGLGEEGTALLEIEDDGSPNLLSRLVGVLEDRQVPFSRLIRVGTGAPGGRGIVYLRIHTYNIHALHAALGKAGVKCLTAAPEES